MNKAYLEHIMSESHIDKVNGIDIPYAFAENISRMRIEHRFTQDDMAYMLGIGKQTYVRIESGTNATVSAEIALKAANIFHVPLMAMFGIITTDVDDFKKYMKCTDRTRRVMRAIMDADQKAQEMLASFKEDDLITVLYFPGEIHDGMNFNRFLHKSFNISEYRRFSWYKDADVLLEINSNAFHPLYHYGDKLVICSRPPLDGEIGLFLKGAEFYLRLTKNTPEKTHLVPVTYDSSTPCLDVVINRRNPEDMNQYSKLGTVIAVI